MKDSIVHESTWKDFWNFKVPSKLNQTKTCQHLPLQGKPIKPLRNAELTPLNGTIWKPIFGPGPGMSRATGIAPGDHLP